jgi:hypothetical protein
VIYSLGATKFDKRNLTVAGDTFQGYTIEKKSGASWDTDVFSQSTQVWNEEIVGCL